LLPVAAAQIVAEERLDHVRIPCDRLTNLAKSIDSKPLLFVTATALAQFDHILDALILRALNFGSHVCWFT
jgi:hypothetical protein